MQLVDIYEDVLNIAPLENVRLSFLIYHDETVQTYFIKSLDFSVDSEGQSPEECKANIQEAILIHLEDCDANANIFDPAARPYWDQFTELKIRQETRQNVYLPKDRTFLRRQKILKYA
jgi:predicted RNase H-like HicB family nuclease